MDRGDRQCRSHRLPAVPRRCQSRQRDRHEELRLLQTCSSDIHALGVAAVDAATNVSSTAATPVKTAACSDATPPSTPGTLSATAVAAAEIDLSWGASTDNVAVTGYEIFRCQGAGCTTFAVLTQTGR